MTWVMPFPEKAITGEYGTMSAFRRAKKMQAHSGTDWAPTGSSRGKTLIPSVANGTIKLVQFSTVLGWVVVQTAAALDGTIWYISYCHLACNKCGINCRGGHPANVALSVKVDDKVAAGSTSHGMKIGNTGSASSGPHLHATASKTLKGVFGTTAQKSDLKKLILANSGPVVIAPTKKEVKVAAKAVKKEIKVAAKIAKKAPAPKPVVKAVVPPAPEIAPPVVHVTAPATIKVTAPKVVKPKEPSYEDGLPEDGWKKYQQALRKHGYKGPIDGIPGKQTYEAMQISAKKFGYIGPIDGVLGSNTYKGVQRRLVAGKTYEGRIDGVWGPVTIKALVEALNTNKY